MKVEYKNIRGTAIKRNLPCYKRCFYRLINCIPYSIHQCHEHTFEENKAQIFNL